MFIDAVFWGALGLILGSFTNVLILREGEKPLTGRSACPSCGRTLEWFELFPILSWILLRGRCRTCKARISVQYPIVEALVGAGFVVVGLSGQSLPVILFSCIAVALLVAITVYDLYHTIIPDMWSYGFALSALAIGALSLPFTAVSDVALFALAGPLVALPLAGLWLVSRGMWMGLGDAKLALGIGWLLGILDGYVALGLAFFIGAFVGVFILLPLQHIATIATKLGITRFGGTSEGYTMKSEVPFGPFLILALCIVWLPGLYGVDVTAHLMDFLSLS